ncbi:MAG TPA: hypothetical protein DEA45_02040 [Acholeplasmataceae bacterium]|nr:hypothetical protein [Acholeplasmataceae bacterium]
MAVLTKSSTVLIGTKQVEVDELIETLIYLPAEKVVNFFQGIGLLVPRKLRMIALRSVLDNVVKSKQIVSQTLSDEVNYRLSWYDNFSESQLEGLLPLFQDDELEKNYRVNLWLRLLTYIFDKQVGEDEVFKLINESKNHYVNLGQVFEDVVFFNKTIGPIFYDEMNRIDGLTPELFRPVLFKSSTLVELREIGKKYGVDVPRRLKKNELQEIIIRELKNNNEYTPEVEEKVKKMAVIQLQRFAKDHNIKASIELKKEEIIEYILANAEGTKELYFIPEHPGVYESIIVPEEKQEEVVSPIEELAAEEPITEQSVVDEPVVEEQIEPVQEEILQEETESFDNVHMHDEHCGHSHDFVVEFDTEEILAELREIKAELANLKAKVEVEEDKPLLDTIAVNAYETKLTRKEWKKVKKVEQNLLSEQETNVQDVPRDINSILGLEEEKPKEQSRFRKILKWTVRGILIAILLLFILAVLKGLTGFSLGFITDNPVSNQIASFFSWVKNIIETII